MPKQLLRHLAYLVLLCIFFQLQGCATKTSRTVNITSMPTGANVYLNNILIGETPIKTTVEQRQGTYNLYAFKAEKDDYMPETRYFKEQQYYQRVTDVVPEEFHFNLRKREVYHIAVTSVPTGADVTLNSQYVGKTPFTLEIKERIGKPRTFELIAEKQGYAKATIVLEEKVPELTVFHFPEKLTFDMEQSSE